MADHRLKRTYFSKRERLWSRPTSRPRARGQALIEYVLILALVTIALIAVLTITGPAVGNVFSNALYNLLGGTMQPRNTLTANEFWQRVTAVASYTPQVVSLSEVNTLAPPTSTPTVGPSPTPSPVTPSPAPTNTPTPGPSPTPRDQNFGYPFNDPASNPDWWKHDFDGLLAGVTWNAEYWDYTTFKSDMSSMPPGSGKWRTTVPALDFYWTGSPGGGVSSNFYARYTATVKLEAKRYTWQIKKDDGIRIWVGGVVVVDQNKPAAGDPITWGWEPLRNNWFSRSFNATAGDNQIVVEFYDSASDGELHVFLTDSGLLDKGDCKWALSGEAFRSSPTAWSDSPGANYAPNSTCTLALRGYIDLRGASRPKLEFWDRYDLYNYTYAKVGVAVAGTGNWSDVNLHYNETNLGWSRQSFDLTNFGDPDGPGPSLGRDFSNELIEVRFTLTTTSSSTRDGWWIDDIEVKEEYLKRYTVGFSDDMESQVPNWIPGGTWALANEQAHSGAQAWSDSPGSNYVHGSNSTLELDGIIDLKLEIVTDPELVFWHRFNLTYNDAIYAEVSTNNRYSWIPLKGGAIEYRTTNLSWNQVNISLLDYKGQEIFFRFRIDATSDTKVADGWWIDDFSLRNRPKGLISLDWCDNMETGGAEWVPDGNWAVVNGPDVNTTQNNQTVLPHSGSQFWSDSPRANYAHSTNSALTLKAQVDLIPAVNPEMVFWHQWDVEYSDNLYVEVSADEGKTWNQVWTYQYNNLPAGYVFVANHGYNHILSWTRESINLKAYKGKMISVRFRFDALYNSAVDDGWWIDDVCFQENFEPRRRVPFSDDFELGPTNWHVGGTWTISTENRYGGATAFSDSPGLYYGHETNSVLELRGTVDLAGAVEPTLYYWDTFNINYEDYALIEINESADGGLTWSGWKELARQRYTTTTSWDRRQVNLKPYINKWIRLRFRLYAERDTRVADGWWIDNVSIVDRDGVEQSFPLTFYETVENTNDYWVMDGTWARIPIFRSIGSGTALGPGGWTAEYYSDTNRNQLFDDGAPKTTRVDAEINFNWGTGRPSGTSLPADDYYMVRWTRTIPVLYNNTVYRIETQSDDGIRVYVDGTPVINMWIDRGFSPTPDVAEVNLAEGNHTVVVEYYEKASDARIFVNFGIVGKVFHDSPAGNYFHQNDMAVTLEGTINLAGTSNPALSYWERRSLGDGDYAITEVSTDEGFTWTAVRTLSGVDATWRYTLIDLTSYAGKQINIRFRIDARSDSRTGDGWYIDDIIVAD